MNGKRGIGSLLIVLIVVAVAVAGWYYYSGGISGSDINVAPAKCVANPELEGWSAAQIAKLGVGIASFSQLDAECGKKLVSIECNGWAIPDSPLKACVWDINVNCGDGVIDAGEGEQCEGTDKFGGKTCMTYGYAGGVLRCRNDCRVDFVDCTN